MWGKLMKSAVVAIVASLALAGCSGGSEPAPEPTTVPGSSVEVTGPLSYTVWSQVLENVPDGIDASSPLFPVTALEDVTSGTVRVFVQESLTDPERKAVGWQIFTLGAWDNTDLGTVVVRDASGVDSNHFRREVPGIEQ